MWNQRRLSAGGATVEEVIEGVHKVKPHRSKRMISEQADRIRQHLHCAREEGSM